LNSTSLQTNSNVNSPVDNSKPLSHLGSGYNSGNRGGMSAKHNVFVLSVDGKPLTPTTNAKARKLMGGKQAKPVWNKFSRFGIQMLVETRKETPKTALGVDFGTKFEGYAVAVGKENNLAVMWKLPNKDKLVRKMRERKILRRTRRQRNCRRRACRFENREKKGFIAPSQLMMVQSRLKCLQEFFNCYPIDTIALEDVRFNHRDKRWGKHFFTMEIGKHKIYGWIKDRARLQLFLGKDTQTLRKKYGYKKSKTKNAEVFNSHCSDALTIAADIYELGYIKEGNLIIVDDTYRCIRRKLYDTQPGKMGIRGKQSTGNPKGIRKGTICEFGQICGLNKKKIMRMYDWDNTRLEKYYNRLTWLSHHFKTKEAQIC
jgi:hypothetical protein